MFSFIAVYDKRLVPAIQSYPKAEVLYRYKMTFLFGLDVYMAMAPLTAIGTLGPRTSLGGMMTRVCSCCIVDIREASRDSDTFIHSLICTFKIDLHLCICKRFLLIIQL